MWTKCTIPTHTSFFVFFVIRLNDVDKVYYYHNKVYFYHTHTSFFVIPLSDVDEVYYFHKHTSFFAIPLSDVDEV